MNLIQQLFPREKGYLLKSSVPRQCWRTTGSLMQIKAMSTAGVEAHQSYGCLLFHFSVLTESHTCAAAIRASFGHMAAENSWPDICYESACVRSSLANTSTFKGKQSKCIHYIYSCGFLMIKSSALKRPQVMHTFSLDVLAGTTLSNNLTEVSQKDKCCLMRWLPDVYSMSDTNLTIHPW